MEGSTIVWIIVAIIVVGGLIAFAMTRSGGRREEAARAKAAEIRESATEHDRALREREASAAEARARSELARAEAEKQQLEAERLADEAAHRSDRAATVRRERDEQLRVADLHDPDVRTDKEGYRIDEHGNRIAQHDLTDQHDRVSDGVTQRDDDTLGEHRADRLDDRTVRDEESVALDERRGGVENRDRRDLDGDGHVDAGEERRADDHDVPGRRG